MLIITNPSINVRLGNFPGWIGGNDALQVFISGLINVALGLGGVVSFFLLLWGGYEYMTAGGDKEATQKAVKRITTAMVGLAILLSSFAIIYIVQTLFGINLTVFTIPMIQ